jgi:hypothetical protein
MKNQFLQNQKPPNNILTNQNSQYDEDKMGLATLSNSSQSSLRNTSIICIWSSMSLIFSLMLFGYRSLKLQIGLVKVDRGQREGYSKQYNCLI